MAFCDPVELALVAERLPRPRLPDDLERLAKAGLALAIGHAIGIVRAHHAAAADPELEATLADVIDGRDLFGDAQGMVQGEDLDGGADVEPAGASRDRAGHLQRGGDHRASRGEVDLPEPHAVDAPRLGPVGHLEDVPEGRGLAGPLTHLLDEQPEVHGVPSRTDTARRHRSVRPRPRVHPRAEQGCRQGRSPDTVLGRDLSDDGGCTMIPAACTNPTDGD